MYVIVDDRESVTGSYAASFDREGVASVGFWSKDFMDWLKTAASSDLLAVDAFMLGECEDRTLLPAIIRKRCSAPIIALRNLKALKETLELFEAGVDDVVGVPVHIREILARTAAIRRRTTLGISGRTAGGAVQVYFDGRDPEIDGEALTLPRRELRILEYMVTHQGRWITKTQIFNAIYGVFDSTFDESVIESHISKLRKKLRARLGYDAILSKRFVGYRLDGGTRVDAIEADEPEEFVETTPTRHCLLHTHFAPALIAGGHRAGSILPAAAMD